MTYLWLQVTMCNSNGMRILNVDVIISNSYDSEAEVLAHRKRFTYKACHLLRCWFIWGG